MTPKERAEKVKIKIATNGATRSEINGDMARWIEEAISMAVEAERKIIGQQMREWGHYGVWDYCKVEGVETIDTVESMNKFALVIEDGAYNPTPAHMWQE